ncbi:hypothetical protein BOX15_Mlig013832g3 [Macrostomum lignano]|uniref:inositol-1,4-bisphosphate 1-phosphatase n=1 Tax=Macrostomum lignano TaxID=282301 RepID=A0A267FSG0_9PLAT|nr:hypothetical protein BOX15_Mlig013832g3 [Macrostomum lignano]
MKVSDLIAELLNAAEKSAELARAIRREESLFHLLIEEKTGDDKNKRFGFDFKTLADVLVQEMIRFDLNKKFSGIGKRVTGEENNKFTNFAGDKFSLEIKDNKKKTTALLCKILDGNDRAATTLANLVHEDVTVPRPPELEKLESLELDKKEIGIWIDPIDGTAEYISGSRDPEFRPGENISQNGLPNVTVLIGVYERSTGLPIIGVINQPFFKTEDGKIWSGRMVWGACIGDARVTSVPHGRDQPPVGEAEKPAVVTSMSDCKKLGTYLCENFDILTAPGAGYKLLCVIDRLCSAYVLSKDNTYRWDTCAPHAILRSQGGGVVKHQQALTADLSGGGGSGGGACDKALRDLQLTYHKAEPKASGSNAWCNMQGVIAYSDPEVLQRLVASLTKK